MLSTFVQKFIGGRTGKREAAWAVFLLWSLAFCLTARQEMAEIDVTGTQAILQAALPFVLAMISVAHGMEWVSTQTRFGGTRDEDPSDFG
jgi:hypothetical protein